MMVVKTSGTAWPSLQYAGRKDVNRALATGDPVDAGDEMHEELAGNAGTDIAKFRHQKNFFSSYGIIKPVGIAFVTGSICAPGMMEAE